MSKDKFEDLISRNLEISENDLSKDSESYQSSRIDAKRMKSAKWIAIEKIEPDPSQPRKVFDDISIGELAQSIKDYGIRQPIVVEQDNKAGCFRIVSGERRYRAAQKMGLSEMPCIVQEKADNALRFVQQLIENIHREDFTPVDKARALIEFKQVLGKGIAWSEVEQKVGISASRRKQFVRLLNLPEKIQSQVVAMGRKPSKYQITEKHARALLLLNKLPDKQTQLFNLIKSGKSSITGDEAIEMARESTGEKAKRTFRIFYQTRDELISKLEGSLHKLRENRGGT